MRYLLICFVLISLPCLANTNGVNTLKVAMLTPKKIAGISIRTSNAVEIESDKSKLPTLWDNFYTEILNKKIDGFPVYGLYTDYESDLNGKYTVLAGVEIKPDTTVPDDLATSEVIGGKYLVFEAQGKMPEIVFETWLKIWDYFSAEDTEHTRAYTSDFELYKSDSQIAIYISIW